MKTSILMWLVAGSLASAGLMAGAAAAEKTGSGAKAAAGGATGSTETGAGGAAAGADSAEQKELITVEGKLYNGRRLRPKVTFYVLPETDPAPAATEGKKTRSVSSSKKKSEAQAQYDKITDAYKKYRTAFSDYDKMQAEYESGRKDIIRKYESNASRDTTKSQSEALKDYASKYKSTLETAKDEVKREAAEFRKYFQVMVNRGKTGGNSVAACTTDGNGGFRVTVEKAGTYYFVFEDPEQDGSKVNFLVFTEHLSADSKALVIDAANKGFAVDKDFAR